MEPSRQTTVLFADITGSTRLYETAGDSRAVEEIAVCMQMLRDAVEAHGGRVVKTMGDAIMALFSTPNAAAAAAARMQTDVESLPAVGSRKLGLRVGFQSGPVIQRENDVFGDTVNLAYRLHEQAVKGQVLTSDDTVSLLAPVIRSATRHLYPVPVKGKAEEVELFELLWEQNADITDVAQTVSLLRSPQARLRLVHRGQDIVRRRGSESLMLGRDQTCQLVIADHKASRQHCTIERRQDKFMLRDHSTNGTFVTVDGELEVVLQREEFQLRKNGWIALGQSRTDTREVVEFFCE